MTNNLTLPKEFASNTDYLNLNDSSKLLIAIAYYSGYGSMTFNESGISLWCSTKKEAAEHMRNLRYLGVKYNLVRLFEKGKWRDVDECEHRWIVNIDFNAKHKINESRLATW